MSNESSGSLVRDVRRVGDAIILAIHGEIDLSCSPEFQRALLAALDEKPGRIVVDLAAVPYMDSSGVASLVKLLSRCRRAGVSLALVGLTERVRSVFEITRLDGVFEIYPTCEEALA